MTRPLAIRGGARAAQRGMTTAEYAVGTVAACGVVAPASTSRRKWVGYPLRQFDSASTAAARSASNALAASATIA